MTRKKEDTPPSPPPSTPPSTPPQEPPPSTTAPVPSPAYYCMAHGSVARDCTVTYGQGHKKCPICMTFMTAEQPAQAASTSTPFKDAVAYGCLQACRNRSLRHHGYHHSHHHDDHHGKHHGGPPRKLSATSGGTYYCRFHGAVSAERAVVNVQGHRQCPICMLLMSSEQPAPTTPTPTPSKDMAATSQVTDEAGMLTKCILASWSTDAAKSKIPGIVLHMGHKR